MEAMTSEMQWEYESNDDGIDWNDGVAFKFLVNGPRPTRVIKDCTFSGDAGFS